MGRHPVHAFAGLACSCVSFGITPRMAESHELRPRWLDGRELEAGLYVSVQHPRVLRETGPVEIKVTLCNLAGSEPVTVESVRYVFPAEGTVVMHPVWRVLPAQQNAYEELQAVVHELSEVADRSAVDRVAELSRRYREVLQRLRAASLVDRYRPPSDEVPAAAGARLSMTVEIVVVQEGQRRVLSRPVEIAVQPGLPSGLETGFRRRFDVVTGGWHSAVPPAASRTAAGETLWFAGDQHLHTTYSLDALVSSGTEETVADYAAAAELLGLDWIIVTDHSNVHFTWSGTEYYTPGQFDAGTAQAAEYTAQNPLLALYGLEMGAGQTGAFALPSHYLAYPFDSDSTGYLENPSSGLIFELANCEPEQVIIDRVNDAGGFGFIAHPFDSGSLAFAQWDFDNGAVGWAGLEIWSDANGQIKTTDGAALSKWYDLLNEIPAPQAGVLADRSGFPNAFPVGLGNSDAHEIGLIGSTFTYAWMAGPGRENVVGALMQGRCVVSNGPLLFGELNGARVGEVAFLLDGDNGLELTLTTTTEFGPVGDYEIGVYVDGALRATLPPSGAPEFSVTVELAGLNLSPPDTFVTLRTDSTDDAFHAITNPIWLQFTAPGDADADGAVGYFDFQQFAGCLMGPGTEREPSCDVLDLDRDRDIDVADFGAFQGLFGGP